MTKHFVLFAENNNLWTVGPGLLVCGKKPKAHDCQTIPRLSKMCGCTVQKNRAATPSGVDDVGLEPLPICHVPYENALIFFEFHRLGEIGGDRKTTLVGDVCSSDHGSMNFRFDQRDIHGWQTNF